ncbi:hypothetical protein L484_010233 [Morus notabilis]|uniref:Uncharacterized protein n=1 Tax=Morus notabilis TaxID=981085 RepID=W9R464_9ROSA|nr:hypothetical protein L484_010233 [Morus notabilis]
MSNIAPRFGSTVKFSLGKESNRYENRFRLLNSEERAGIRATGRHDKKKGGAKS